MPMPAFVKIDFFGTDVPADETGLATTESFPCLSLMLPSGPGGDFFAGSPVIPVSMEMQLGGIKVFIPDSLLPNCRVTLSASPLDTSIVDVEMSFSFDRGDSHYEGEYSSPVCFPGVALPSAPPFYPPSIPPETLVFCAAGDTFRPVFFSAIEEPYGGAECYSVYAFTEPFTGAMPSKAEQTRLRFRIPVDRVDGRPVDATVDALILTPADTVFLSAGYAFCWAEGQVDGTVLRGTIHFQGNGSETATFFWGGGPFTAPIK
jgi:hypothetical protein